jgi:hypothetical protein
VSQTEQLGVGGEVRRGTAWQSVTDGAARSALEEKFGVAELCCVVGARHVRVTLPVQQEWKYVDVQICSCLESR